MTDDEKIIELFFARDQQGIQELDLKYGKACHSLSYHIVNDRNDAEECVNEAYETASEEERDYASILADAPHHAYSGQCTYCGHCAPCPKGIDIAMVNKLHDLAVMQPQVPESIRAHYQALSAKAEDCIACGNCEQRCPFGVPVIERMEKIKELRLL